MMVITGLSELTDFELEHVLFLVAPFCDSPYREEAKQPGPLNTAKTLLVAESCRRSIGRHQVGADLKMTCKTKLIYVKEALQFIAAEAEKLQELRV